MTEQAPRGVEVTDGQKTQEFGSAIQEIAGALSTSFLKESLQRGRTIHIPSEGLVIHPDRGLISIDDLTEEERRQL